jgi:predicted ribonuclease YlaK
MSWKTVEVSEQDFLLLKDHNKPIEHINDITPNEGVVVQSVAGQQMNAIFEVGVGIRKINDYNPQFKNSRNRDLARLNDLLNNPKINTIILDGFFGTGKTSNVMSFVVDYLKNDKNPSVYISKPHVPVGKSYGHLPGELKDKIHYEFRSYYQYIDRFWQKGMADLIISLSDVDVNKNSMAFKELGGIHFEALPFEYIRGLDIEKGWVILDESQNTDIQEMVSFVSRDGDDVKLILLGDTHSAQIDRKSVLDPKKNGFAFIKEAYKDKPYSAVVNLTTRNHIIRGDRVKHLYDAISSQNQ